MRGEIDGFRQDRIEIAGLGSAAVATRMLQHVAHDAVSPLAMLGYFAQVGAERDEELLDLFAPFGIQLGQLPATSAIAKPTWSTSMGMKS